MLTHKHHDGFSDNVLLQHVGNGCEVSLLASAYQRSTTSRDVLMDVAKRYRVDTEKLQKAVAKEFAAKRDKKAVKPKVCKGAH